MATLSPPFSNERAANGHQLLHNLAFPHLAVVNSWLTIQSKCCAAKRAALACFKEMPAQSLDRPRVAAITNSGFGLKRCNRRIWTFQKPAYPKQHVIRILGLLPTGKRVQLQHQQRANA